MHDIRFSQNDIVQHVVSFGLDVHPPVEINNERTRLTMFFEEAREKWPALYEQLTVGERDFRISKSFRKRTAVSGPAIQLDTFVLTPRGPVFVFPLRLPDPVGATELEDDYRNRFAEISKAFWSAVPGHTILRVGLIRDVIFSTGKADCTVLLSGRTDWCKSKLVGGNRLHSYRDEKYNIRLELSPVKIMQGTQLAVGARVEQSAGFGLKVSLDVNNIEICPLQDADIDEVIERADGFWPDEVLEYLSGVE